MYSITKTHLLKQSYKYNMYIIKYSATCFIYLNDSYLMTYVVSTSYNEGKEG